MKRLVTDAVELDLYECMKYDPFRHHGEMRAYLRPPYNLTIYIPLARTRQRYGNRLWFSCKGCGRRVTKLYAWSTFAYQKTFVACRHCLDLKYASQYRPSMVARCDMSDRKLERLARQKRRLWYGDKPTKFGSRYYKLRDEQERIREEAWLNLLGTVSKLRPV